MASGCYVAYFRVSTDRQGRSGLGLDAQRDAVAAFLDGGDCKVVAEFQEVESGRDDDRPELAKAIARCRLTGSKLLIAKMDRLARRVSFVANLPGMTRFTAHIYAAVGEEEARMISERTRSALAAVKARGEKRLGNPQGFAGKVYREGGKARAKMADDFAARVGPLVRQMREEGLSLRDRWTKPPHRRVRECGRGAGGSRGPERRQGAGREGAVLSSAHR